MENTRFCHLFFFIFTLLMLLFCYTSLVTIITFLDSLFLNAYGNIKYGLVQSFNVVVNYFHARTESCLQDVQLCTSVQLWALILNCFVKHYGSKFLISEQEALCLTLEPYYICFLVLLWYLKVLWCHLAIDHLFQSVALSGELFLRSQSETFKCSDLISNFWTRQIKKPWLKGIFLPVFKTF